MPKEIIRVPVISDTLEKLGVPLSPVVKANGFIFVSGMPPLDHRTGELVKGDVEKQTEVVLDSLKHCLEAAGASMENVVKVNVYAANAAHFARVNEVYRRYFAEAPPARTFATVGSWPLDFDIEIECVALAE